MRQVLGLAVWLLARIVVPLRYRIHVRGWDQVRTARAPVLLLPSHPALIDPLLILCTFYGRLRPRPVLYEGNFRSLLLRPFASLLRAIPVPDLSRPDAAAGERASSAVTEVIASLRRGENVVLWPSGKAQRDGLERLGASRALTQILSAVPEASIVTVRTRGLWGSMYSFAQTGRLPVISRCVLSGLGWLLAGLIVFVPRRRVEMTAERISRDRLPDLERENINSWFETWYNAKGQETPTFVPYHLFLGPRTFDFHDASKSHLVTTHVDHVSEEVREGVKALLADEVDPSLGEIELEPAQRLEDLGLDSLQRMELTLQVAARFQVSPDATPVSVGELWHVAAGGSLAESGGQVPPAWTRSLTAQEPRKILAETIPEAFVARALMTPQRPVAADEYAGVITYGRMLMGAELMARRFRQLPEERVGLLLPASVACDTMLFGLYLAGKVPVLLNWTTGPSNLQHAVGLTGLRHVVTSQRLRERLGLSIEGVRYLDVETLRDEVSATEKLSAWLHVHLLPWHVRRTVPRPAVDDPAVILFTSGSEKAPKAVPLTHRNVLTNQKAALETLSLTAEDAVFAFLPMFHSFGFTMTGLLPLLAGIRLVHHADPTDVAAICRKIAAYQPTILVATPTFLGHIFDRAGREVLASLKLVVVGAEKCPDRVFNAARRIIPQATLLEGYGITECSPVVAVNRAGNERRGSVGQPLPGVDVRVVDLETEAGLDPGEMGMLLVGGAGVFPGYLGHEKSPFVEREGKRWYVTGDLVEQDAEGFLYFRGRLKRFLKAGGEMISLVALEEPLASLFPPDDHGPRVAVEGIELDEGRQIVLFTTEPIELHEANAVLKAAGFRGIMRLDEVRRVEQIPVLGTGKVDYKQLRAMLNAATPENA